MDSPLTAPILIENASDDEFDELPMIEHRRTRSFDHIESADTLDLTYSYSADINSPIASIAFMPRNLSGAPKLPSPPVATRQFVQEQFTPVMSRQPEGAVESHINSPDYVLSEEDDYRLHLAARRFGQEKFTPVNRRPEEQDGRHLNFADYDLSEEEDDLLDRGCYFYRRRVGNIIECAFFRRQPS